MEREKKPYDLLELENKRLKERILKLEEQQGKQKEERKSPDTAQKRVIKLVQEKDKTLQDYTEKLEMKTEELKKTVDELQLKNVELSNSLAAVKFYQEIFENEPAALVGLDDEGNIMQFNSAAINFFGNEIHSFMLHDFKNLSKISSDENIIKIVEKTISEQIKEKQQTKIEEQSYLFSTFPLISEGELRGIVLKIRKEGEEGVES